MKNDAADGLPVDGHVEEDPRVRGRFFHGVHHRVSPGEGFTIHSLLRFAVELLIIRDMDPRNVPPTLLQHISSSGGYIINNNKKEEEVNK